MVFGILVIVILVQVLGKCMIIGYLDPQGYLTQIPNCEIRSPFVMDTLVRLGKTLSIVLGGLSFGTLTCASGLG